MTAQPNTAGAIPQDRRGSAAHPEEHTLKLVQGSEERFSPDELFFRDAVRFIANEMGKEEQTVFSLNAQKALFPLAYALENGKAMRASRVQAALQRQIMKTYPFTLGKLLEETLAGTTPERSAQIETETARFEKQMEKFHGTRALSFPSMCSGKKYTGEVFFFPDEITTPQACEFVRRLGTFEDGYCRETKCPRNNGKFGCVPLKHG